MLMRGPTIMLDDMVDQGITAIAREYVELHLRSIKPSLEEALTSLLSLLPIILRNAFVKAIVGALDKEWAFDLDIKVSQKKDSDDD